MDLHKRLVGLQSDEELARKTRKALCWKNKQWTQEDLDLADRQAERLWAKLGFR